MSNTLAVLILSMPILVIGGLMSHTIAVGVVSSRRMLSLVSIGPLLAMVVLAGMLFYCLWSSTV